MKVAYGQLQMLLRSGAIPHFFNDIRWVYLRRRDIVSQAISYSIADQTKQWSSVAASQGILAKFDFKDIESKLDKLSMNYISLDSFCSERSINPYRIYFEDLVVDTKMCTRKLAEYLGASNVEINESRLRLRRQHTALNEEFKRKFLEEYQGPLHPEID